MLALGHFAFGLTPFLWLVSLLATPSTGLRGGGGQPAADELVESLFALFAILTIVGNCILCLCLGYGLWICNNGARLLVMVFGIPWVLLGAYTIYTIPVLTLSQPLTFLRLFMIIYGFGVLYYLTRYSVKTCFRGAFQRPEQGKEP